MLIDAHAHLDRYEADLETALEEISTGRIFTLSNSMDLPSYRRNQEIAEMCPLVWPTFGVHPWNAPEYIHSLEELNDIISQSLMLGEIGLDYQFVEDTSQYPAQREVFEFFLRAAKKQDKIVNLHTKGSEQEVLDLLERHDIPRVIVHWYSGPLQVLHKLTDRGTYLTVGVEILHSDDIKAIARELPMELLLTETDNPGGLRWLTGAPGMPLVVRDVVGALAELRRSSVEEVMQTVQSNFERLIGDDSRLSEMYARLLERQQKEFARRYGELDSENSHHESSVS